MKKTKIIITIAVAVVLSIALAMTALAASAPTVSASTTTALPGATVTFTITANNTDLQGRVTASANLVYVDSSSPGAELQATSPNGFAVLGATSITYTYTVAADAVPDAVFSFTVSDIVGGDGTGTVEGETSWPNISASGTVATPPTPEPPPPDPTPAPATPTPPPGQLDDVPKVGDIPPEGNAAAIIIAAAILGMAGLITYIKLR